MDQIKVGINTLRISNININAVNVMIASVIFVSFIDASAICNTAKSVAECVIVRLPVLSKNSNVSREVYIYIRFIFLGRNDQFKTGYVCIFKQRWIHISAHVQ